MSYDRLKRSQKEHENDTADRQHSQPCIRFMPLPLLYHIPQFQQQQTSRQHGDSHGIRLANVLSEWRSEHASKRWAVHHAQYAGNASDGKDLIRLPGTSCECNGAVCRFRILWVRSVICTNILDVDHRTKCDDLATHEPDAVWFKLIAVQCSTQQAGSRPRGTVTTRTRTRSVILHCLKKSG